MPGAAVRSLLRHTHTATLQKMEPYPVKEMRCGQLSLRTCVITHPNTISPIEVVGKKKQSFELFLSAKCGSPPHTQGGGALKGYAGAHDKCDYHTLRPASPGQRQGHVQANPRKIVVGEAMHSAARKLRAEGKVGSSGKCPKRAKGKAGCCLLLQLPPPLVCAAENSDRIFFFPAASLKNTLPSRN